MRSLVTSTDPTRGAADRAKEQFDFIRFAGDHAFPEIDPEQIVGHVLD